jgi:hypothetical protein
MTKANNELAELLRNADTIGARTAAWKIIGALPPSHDLPDAWGDPVPQPFDVTLLPRELHELSDFVAESTNHRFLGGGAASARRVASHRLGNRAALPIAADVIRTSPATQL